MRKAWIVAACLSVGTISNVALGQFGGGFGEAVPAPTTSKAIIDKTVTPDYAPIVVLDAAARKSLDNVVSAVEKPLPALEFRETPLSECVQQLQKASGVRITIDERALSDASIGADTLITLPEEEVTLRIALDTIGNDLGLGWFPGRGGIVITTKEERDANQLAVIYPVTDLIATSAGDDYDSLISTITSSLERTSWWEGAGNGKPIAHLPASGAIIITAPWYIHEQINPLLQGLRDAKKKQGVISVQLKRDKNATPPVTSGAQQPTGGGGGFF